MKEGKSVLVNKRGIPLKDFKGQKLCESCWNGNHYSFGAKRVPCAYHKANKNEDNRACKACRWVNTKEKQSNCSGEPCECSCRELLAEKHPRLKKDKSAQVNISDLVGDDVIVVGNPQNPKQIHRDDA